MISSLSPCSSLSLSVSLSLSLGIWTKSIIALLFRIFTRKDTQVHKAERNKLAKNKLLILFLKSLWSYGPFLWSYGSQRKSTLNCYLTQHIACLFYQTFTVKMVESTYTYCATLCIVASFIDVTNHSGRLV